jgi:glutamate-1-semialdehyde 2,1-aminomutase
LATLRLLAGPGVYDRLEESGGELHAGLTACLERHGIAGCVSRVGSMLTLFFGPERVLDADQARSCDTARFARFFHAMLKRGVYFPPSQFEAAFVSAALEPGDISSIIAAVDDWGRAESGG